VKENLMSNAQRTKVKEELQLVKAARAGDRAAFDELVRLYQKQAMQVAVRMSGDADEAAEAVQAGFLNAFLNIGKLKEPKYFKVWLLRIISNAAITQLRESRHREKKVNIVEPVRNNKIPLPSDRENSRELKEAIQKAMIKLSKKEAKAISLFSMDDFSHKEVAEIMNCSVSSAKWYVFQARKKLKVLLRNYL
jgi:RNA polymerase sigma-70 factor (ECF subfamily)